MSCQWEQMGKGGWGTLGGDFEGQAKWFERDSFFLGGGAPQSAMPSPLGVHGQNFFLNI